MSFCYIRNCIAGEESLPGAGEPNRQCYNLLQIQSKYTLLSTCVRAYDLSQRCIGLRLAVRRNASYLRACYHDSLPSYCTPIEVLAKLAVYLQLMLYTMPLPYYRVHYNSAVSSSVSSDSSSSVHRAYKLVW
jgi:hypothetical protein